MTGAIEIEGADRASLARSRVTIAAPALAGINGMGMPGGVRPRQVVNDDWTFAITGIVGAARLRVTLPEGWAVKAMTHGDRDIATVPVELKGGESLTGVRIVVTDRVGTLSGALVDEAATPVADGTIVMFSADTAKWFEASPFVRAVRPDQKGQYRISGILPGDYLAVAPDYVEQGMWNDREYLESVRPHAQRVRIEEGKAHVLSLPLVTP